MGLRFGGLFLTDDGPDWFGVPVKNTSTRCEGLSPGLFIFTILGNATYTASILVVGLDRQHLIVNASWLAGMLGGNHRNSIGGLGLTACLCFVGSALTIFLDLFVSTGACHMCTMG